MKHKENFSK